MYPFDFFALSRLSYEERLREAEQERRFRSMGTRVPSAFHWVTALIGQFLFGHATLKGGASPQATPAR